MDPRDRRARARRRSRAAGRACVTPHYSRISIGGYRERLEEALDGRAGSSSWTAGTTTSPTSTSSPSAFVGRTPTWSSRPTACRRRILAEGDPYRDQLLETSRLVADRAGVSDWSFAFQSESPTGEPWKLGLDILVELETLHADGVRKALDAPAGFVCTPTPRSCGISTSRHGTSSRLRLGVDRIESPNADLAFIRALAGLVEKAFGAGRRIGVR